MRQQTHHGGLAMVNKIERIDKELMATHKSMGLIDPAMRL
jgi:hypothetical protein